MAARVAHVKHRSNGEVCVTEEERGGQIVHGIVGREEKERSSGSKSTGGAGHYADNSRIEKGCSSRRTGGSREGA